jgi:hypothetical protein
VLNNARALWEKRYCQRDVRPSSSSRLSPPPHTIEPDEFDIISREMDVVQLAQLGKDDFDAFIEADPFKIKDSALEWWTEESQRQAYPLLSQMAIDLFSIPAMSVEVERVFSGARRTISWERSSLGGQRIERLECLKHWLNRKVLDNIKIVVEDDIIELTEPSTPAMTVTSDPVVNLTTEGLQHHEKVANID